MEVYSRQILSHSNINSNFVGRCKIAARCISLQWNEKYAVSSSSDCFHSLVVDKSEWEIKKQRTHERFSHQCKINPDHKLCFTFNSISFSLSVSLLSLSLSLSSSLFPIFLLLWLVRSCSFALATALTIHFTDYLYHTLEAILINKYRWKPIKMCHFHGMVHMYRVVVAFVSYLPQLLILSLIERRKKHRIIVMHTCLYAGFSIQLTPPSIHFLSSEIYSCSVVVHYYYQCNCFIKTPSTGLGEQGMSESTKAQA